MNTTSWAERERLSVILLENLKSNVERIDEMAARFTNDEFDLYYRMYHYSFKVFSRQQSIRNAIELFESLAPEGRAINGWFKSIVYEGLAQSFEMARTNENWLAECRPIIEAWSHCHAFLITSASTASTSANRNLTSFPKRIRRSRSVPPLHS
jgi:hypothetical protein